MLLFSQNVIIQVRLGGLKVMLPLQPESMCENYAFAGAAIWPYFYFFYTLRKIRMVEKSDYDSQVILTEISICNTSRARRPIHPP